MIRCLGKQGLECTASLPAQVFQEVLISQKHRSSPAPPYTTSNMGRRVNCSSTTGPELRSFWTPTMSDILTPKEPEHLLWGTNTQARREVTVKRTSWPVVADTAQRQGGFAFWTYTRVWWMTLGQRFKELQGKDRVKCEECPTRHRGQNGKPHRPSSVAQRHDYGPEHTFRGPGWACWS